MNKFIPILFLLSIILVGCEQPKEKAAEVTEAQEVKEIKPQQKVNIKRYAVRPAESEVNWIGSKPTGKHYGTLGIENGSIHVQEDSIISGKVIIDMDDIDVVDLRSDEDSYMKLVEHLKSEDFFDVEKHPYSVFEFTSLSPLDPADIKEQEYNYTEQNKPTTELLGERKTPTHIITGNLTLRGKTLSIKFPGYLEITDEKIICSAKFSIDRTQWGVKYREEAEFKNKAQDKLIYNDVIIDIGILAKPIQENF
ncbi:MAG: YceI family protein [Candidatus Cyclobacteriaceae bacterium M2_1C_046]